MRKFPRSKVYFTTTRKLTTSSLNLAIANEEGVSEVEFKMDYISIPYKIVFHKGVSDLIYVNVTKEALSHLKSQQRVVKLETQLKQEKETNKARNPKAEILHNQAADLTTKMIYNPL